MLSPVETKGTLVAGRPPNWTREELILALDLYLSSGRKVLDSNRPETISLAALLNRLPHEDASRATAAKRTPGSVEAKLANFRAIDPMTTSAGFGNGSRLDLEVWNEFADKSELLMQAVAVICARANTA